MGVDSTDSTKTKSSKKPETVSTARYNNKRPRERRNNFADRQSSVVTGEEYAPQSKRTRTTAKSGIDVGNDAWGIVLSFLEQYMINRMRLVCKATCDLATLASRPTSKHLMYAIWSLRAESVEYLLKYHGERINTNILSIPAVISKANNEKNEDLLATSRILIALVKDAHKKMDRNKREGFGIIDYFNPICTDIIVRGFPADRQEAVQRMVLDVKKECRKEANLDGKMTLCLSQQYIILKKRIDLLNNLILMDSTMSQYQIDHRISEFCKQFGHLNSRDLQLANDIDIIVKLHKVVSHKGYPRASKTINDGIITIINKWIDEIIDSPEISNPRYPELTEVMLYHAFEDRNVSRLRKLMCKIGWDVGWNNECIRRIITFSPHRWNDIKTTDAHISLWHGFLVSMADMCISKDFNKNATSRENIDHVNRFLVAVIRRATCQKIERDSETEVDSETRENEIFTVAELMHMVHEHISKKRAYHKNSATLVNLCALVFGTAFGITRSTSIKTNAPDDGDLYRRLFFKRPSISGECLLNSARGIINDITKRFSPEPGPDGVNIFMTRVASRFLSAEKELFCLDELDRPGLLFKREHGSTTFALRTFVCGFDVFSPFISAMASSSSTSSRGCLTELKKIVLGEFADTVKVGDYLAMEIIYHLSCESPDFAVDIATMSLLFVEFNKMVVLGGISHHPLVFNSIFRLLRGNKRFKELYRHQIKDFVSRVRDKFSSARFDFVSGDIKSEISEMGISLHSGGYFWKYVRNWAEELSREIQHARKYIFVAKHLLIGEDTITEIKDLIKKMREYHAKITKSDDHFEDMLKPEWSDSGIDDDGNLLVIKESGDIKDDDDDDKGDHNTERQ